MNTKLGKSIYFYGKGITTGREFNNIFKLYNFVFSVTSVFQLAWDFTESHWVQVKQLILLEESEFPTIDRLFNSGFIFGVY